MSFFIRKLNKNLHKDGKRTKNSFPGRKEKRPRLEDEEIESDDEVINGKVDIDNVEQPNNDLENHVQEEDEEDFFEETEQEKKIRVAKKYLEDIKTIHKAKNEDEELDDLAINAKLKEDVLKRLGTLYTKLVDSIEKVDENQVKYLRNAHRLPITCFVVSADSKYLFSASKCATIVKWNLITNSKVKVVKRDKKQLSEAKKLHSSPINAISITTDGKFLATGCDDNFINIWNADSLELLHRFTGHSGPITGLAFRRHDHTLYSISKDRSLRVWDLGTMCYIQTLFGHQETITSIDMLIKERAITSGGYDATIRLWKVSEESQLIFSQKTSSIDIVRYIDEQHFISGSMDGSISLWNAQKKRPLFVQPLAHGEDHESGTANWIISLATVPFSDLFASGSKNGKVLLWKFTKQNFTKVFEINVTGFVNSLSFADDGKKLIVSVAQEHKLGRWWRLREAKNQILVFPIKLKQT